MVIFISLVFIVYLSVFCDFCFSSYLILYFLAVCKRFGAKTEWLVCSGKSVKVASAQICGGPGIVKQYQVY